MEENARLDPADDRTTVWSLWRDVRLMVVGLLGGLFFDVSGLTEANPGFAWLLGGSLLSIGIWHLLTNDWIKVRYAKFSTANRRVIQCGALVPFVTGLLFWLNYPDPVIEGCSEKPILSLSIERFESEDYFSVSRVGPKLNVKLKFEVKNSGNEIAYDVTPQWADSKPIDIAPGQHEYFEQGISIAPKDLDEGKTSAVLQKYLDGESSLKTKTSFRYLDECGKEHLTSAEYEVWKNRAILLKRDY